MALPWFKVKSDVVRHPKLLDLSERLGCDGLGVLVRLWSWTASYFADGFIPEKSIAAAAEEAIRGSPVTVTVTHTVTALAESGWLDASDGGFEVHDWVDLQGAHAAAAAKNRERQQRHREKERETRNALRNSLRNGKVTPEIRGEENRSDQQQEPLPPPSASASLPLLVPVVVEPKPVPVVVAPDQEIARLEAEWPTDLLSRIRLALESTRASGSMSESKWRGFLKSSANFARSVRVSAAETYLERACASERKGERYLIGIMRGNNAPPTLAFGVRRNAGPDFDPHADRGPAGRKKLPIHE